MRKLALWGGQAALVAIVAWYLWSKLGPAWQQFSAAQLDLTIKPLWIGAAALTIFATYAVLIEAWRRVLLGWAQRIDYVPAVRIWCLSNLARVVPGRVWSVAGMAMMARGAGVEMWAAVGSAVVIQALAVATGVLVGAVLAPEAQTPVTVGVAVALAAAAMSPFVWPTLGNRLIGMVKPGFHLKPVARGPLINGAITTLVSWLSYGTALWLLAHGIFQTTTLTLDVAVGGFAVAYVLGLVAVFTPGGLVVREAVLTGILTPAVGASQALALALASRVLTTLTEGGSGLLALALRPRSKETVHEPS
ncbi:MAG TPA: lysylphosphatidylglycerol synthase domain-containing protein [Gemmatimonadales bacterium]|jgi:hypothetical protein